VNKNNEIGARSDKEKSMDFGDHDSQKPPPNLAEEPSKREYNIPLEVDAASFGAHPYGNAISSPVLVAPAFRQYPLTPLEGPNSVASEPPIPFQLHPDASLTEPHRFYEPSAFPPLLEQTAWPGPPVHETLVSVDGQLSNMSPEYVLPNKTQRELQYQYDLGYFQPSDTYEGEIAAEGPLFPWEATIVPDVAVPLVPASQENSDGRPTLEKEKKKRGRPRLYEDDGVERPKRKPGRPPTYVVGPESGSSVSPYYPFLSLPSPSESSFATRPGWSSNQELVQTFSAPTSGTRKASGSSSSSSITNKGKVRGGEKAKEFPATISENGEGEDGDGDAQKLAVTRARNKTAATRYRAKTQATISIMEAEEREVSARRQALIACANQLREEVFHLKNEVLRQTDCGCPLIAGYLAEAARLAYSPGQESQLMGGITNSIGGIPSDRSAMDGIGFPGTHLEECFHFGGVGDVQGPGPPGADGEDGDGFG